MSDQIETPTEQPNAEASQAAEQPVTEQPFAVFKDAKSFTSRVSREARKLMNDQAKAAGFDDWQHMQDALGTLRQQPAQAPQQPENPQDSQNQAENVPQVQIEAKRLKMALSVASDLNLPTALVSRLQGDTAEEMTADANRLLALFQQPARGPGIPPAPQTNRPVTFTRAQLQNAEFVRQNKDAIIQASREGRIVDS